MRTRSQSRNNFPQQEASPAIVEPLRIEFPFLEDQFQEDPPKDPPEVLKADNRTMAELLQAPTDGYEDAIDSLNSAAGGNFLDKMPRECLKIIESKSKVRQTRAKAVVAKVSTSSSTPAISFDVAELKDMVRALLLDKKNQSSAPASSYTPAPVKAVEPNCVTCGGTHSYQNCPATSGNVYRDNIQEYVSQAAAANYNQENTGFRPQMVANQIRPPIFPPYQNNQNNFNRGNNFNQNRGGNFNQSNFNQGGNFNQGQLFRPQVNQPPVYQAPAYQAPIPQTQSVSKTDFESYIKANDAVLRNMQNQGQNLQIHMANLTDMLSKFVSSNTASSSGAGTLPSTTITNAKEDLKGITTRSGVAYQGPTIPTPSKVVRQGTEALIGNKEKLSEMDRTPMNEHCSAVILNKLPRKLGDPGKFLIPCEFPGMDECLALANLGASINLMPLSVWEGLSLSELTPTFMNLELADRSLSKPISIAKDVSVKVGVFHFPADFVVVDFEPDPRVLLILGRCFLKTGRALIDVHKGEITLRIINEAITYNLDQTLRYSANYNQMTANKIDVTYEEYSQKVLGFSDTTTSGNLTPHDDPIVSTTSPTLTPFGDSDFLLFVEADAFLGLEDDPNSPEFNPFYYGPEGDILLLEAILNSKPLLPLPNHEQYLPSIKKELKGDNKLPVIIAKELGDEEKSALIKVLKSYKRAIAWKLSDIHGNEFYCFLDDFFGYFQTPIDPHDQEKTTFTCPYGTFAYRCMPFGLCNAPGMFQRYMLAILHDMVEKMMEVFMDDFSIFRNSFENCLSRLDKMLQRIAWILKSLVLSVFVLRSQELHILSIILRIQYPNLID
nr:reverse transcriptase domain-containing protein [Tanacetum cinerariifolium]